MAEVDVQVAVDEEESEEKWLYGDSNLEQIATEDKQDSADVTVESIDALPTEDDSTSKGATGPDKEEGQLSGEEEQQDQSKNETRDGEEGDEDDDDDDSDDDVQVVIGDIKTSPTYTTLNLKRGPLTSALGDKTKPQPGKFSIEEFEAVGTINGLQAHEFNLDSLEDKPWRKPGADITDYFNYGFNEETWRAYCERQKRMRIHESGVGLGQIGGGVTGPGAPGTVKQGNIPVAIVNDNSKYSGIAGPKKAGPPPGRKLAGTIDVIGGTALASRRSAEKGTPPKENVIQVMGADGRKSLVMTADRREYSRKPFPDMSVPPPPPGVPPFDMPPPGIIPSIGGFAGHSPYGGEFYTPESDPYYHSYEPTQDSQWSNHQTWDSSAAADGNQSGLSGMNDTSNQDSQDAFSSRGSTRDEDHRGDDRGRSRDKDRDKDKDRERERDRDKDKEKDRERKERSRHHRTRSRSPDRKRRHKSRSRSPSHRHRKKKSRREREGKEESE